MTTSDPLSILLAHDHWATHQILRACAPLTHDQFHRRFEMGPGSLHDTITHVLGAMRTWTQTLRGIEPPAGPRLEEGPPRTVDQLMALLDEVTADFRAETARLPLDQLMPRTLRGGRFCHLTRAVIFTHVATHSMHHRAQCLNMLRHLGVTPLPPSSVTEWSLASAPA